MKQNNNLKKIIDVCVFDCFIKSINSLTKLED